jgi:hypothetical protein
MSAMSPMPTQRVFEEPPAHRVKQPVPRTLALGLVSFEQRMEQGTLEVDQSHLANAMIDASEASSVARRLFEE